MSIVTIEIKKSYARQVLNDLQKIQAISYVKKEVKNKKIKKFDAIRISTKDFIFNREEANER